VSFRLPIAVRVGVALVMVALAARVAGPELAWDAAQGSWATVAGFGAFTAGYLLLVVRFLRLAVLTDGRLLTVRGMLRSRRLDRADVTEVRTPGGARSAAVGEMLQLVLASGKVVPLEVTARAPVPGARRRAAAQREQLQDWLDRSR
jgi:hypothetical protein